jgi:hypothetical protein
MNHHLCNDLLHRRPSPLPIGVVMLIASLAGCTHAPQAVVATSASREFSCPTDRIDVEGVGGWSFQATGCGMSATYSCSGGGSGSPFTPTCARAGDPIVVGVASPQGR